MNTATGNYRYLIILKLYRDGDFGCGSRQGCLDYFGELRFPSISFNSAGNRVGPSRLMEIQSTRPIRDTLKNPVLRRKPFTWKWPFTEATP